jgi:hypothetical protein
MTHSKITNEASVLVSIAIPIYPVSSCGVAGIKRDVARATPRRRWFGSMFSDSLARDELLVNGRMTGIELATQITLARPAIKVLLMSGFTGGMLVLNEGWHFLPKPFISSQLKTLVVGLLSPDLKSRFSSAA